jgi:UDP-N-acetylglucosamine acyltransferase
MSDEPAMGSAFATLDDYRAYLDGIRGQSLDRTISSAFGSVSSDASIGSPGEDRRKPVRSCPNYGAQIGLNVTIREFVTVNGGFEAATEVGDGCYLMTKSHVGHDCRLARNVTLCTGAILGGHTVVHEGATIGIGAVTHQRTVIGAYAMIGMGAVVTKDVPPFAVVYGNPARVHGINRVGMERAGFTADEIFDIEHGKRTKWHEEFERDAGGA